MTKYVKVALLAVVVLALLLTAATNSTGMKSLDVVGKNSVTAFGLILDNVQAEETGSGWSLAAPDGSARFVWGRELVRLELDAAPFIKAGLDPAKLPANYAYRADGAGGENAAEGGVLTVGMNLTPPLASALASALDAYALLVDQHRGMINYHTFLDHYGVRVGGGNMFEWAKDMATNAYDNSVQDKDGVFALNPAPLAEAGLVPEALEGWAHAQVPVETDSGIVLEWNLLKPFDLQ